MRSNKGMQLIFTFILVNEYSENTHKERWCLSMRYSCLYVHIYIGMKAVGNGRENTLTIPAPVFFGQER